MKLNELYEYLVQVFPRYTKNKSLFSFSRFVALSFLFFSIPLLASPAPAFAKTQEKGIISWYGPQFHGKTTASGTRFDSNTYTAAHKTIPFGTVLRVHYPQTKKNILVEVNDRGPFIKGRILDLSKQAAKAIGLIKKGADKATIEIISDKNGEPLNTGNAFYIRLTKLMPTAEADSARSDLRKHIQGKPLFLLYTSTSKKESAIVSLGPYKNFTDARVAYDALPKTLQSATIIEAPEKERLFIDPNLKKHAQKLAKAQKLTFQEALSPSSSNKRKINISTYTAEALNK